MRFKSEMGHQRIVVEGANSELYTLLKSESPCFSDRSLYLDDVRLLCMDFNKIVFISSKKKKKQDSFQMC